MTVAVVSDVERWVWTFLELHDNPFGYKASVNNFTRLPERVVGVSRRLLGIVCDRFYDDTGILGYVRRY